MMPQILFLMNKVGQLVLPILFKQVLYSSIVFALIFILTTLHKKMPSQWRLGLWTLVFLRLILPPQLSHTYSVRHYLDKLFHISFTQKADEVFITDSHNPAPDTPTEFDSSHPQKNTGSIAAILFLVWVAGSTVFFIIYSKKWQWYRKLARQASPVKLREIGMVSRKWRSLFRIRRDVRIVTSDRIVSPFTIGTHHPIIVLPNILLKSCRRKHIEPIIAHEMAHIRRHDDLWIKLQNLIQIVYFFHPLVWLTSRRIHLERECICDSMVLSAGEISRELYGSGLLTALKCSLGEPDRIGLVPEFGSRLHSWKIRIQNLKGDHVMKKHRSMLIGIVIICLGFIVLPMGKNNITLSVNASEFTSIPEESIVESNPGIPNVPNTQRTSIRLSEPMNTGKITFRFGRGIHPFKKTEYMHNGIDIAAPKGTSVFAAADGTVLSAGMKDSYGNLIVIQHDENFQTKYAHLDSIIVAHGHEVHEGDRIGLVGNTGVSSGPHLHFELLKNENHVNPEDYIDF